VTDSRVNVRPGMIVRRHPDDSEWLILRVGRGMVRSVVAIDRSGTTALFTEIDYWWPRHGYEVVSYKSRNVKWARAYCKSHPHLPVV